MNVAIVLVYVALLALGCRIGLHDWQNTNYPEWQYYPIASYAGTKHCRKCKAFRYWTTDEESAWLGGNA